MKVNNIKSTLLRSNRQRICDKSGEVINDIIGERENELCDPKNNVKNKQFQRKFEELSSGNVLRDLGQVEGGSSL